MIAPFAGHESPQSIANFDNGHIFWSIYVVKPLHKHVTICGDGSDPFGDDRPNIIHPVVDRSCDLVFLRISRHFEPGGQWKKRLGRKNGFESLWQPFFRRRIEIVAI